MFRRYSTRGIETQVLRTPTTLIGSSHICDIVIKVFYFFFVKKKYLLFLKKEIFKLKCMNFVTFYFYYNYRSFEFFKLFNILYIFV